MGYTRIRGRSDLPIRGKTPEQGKKRGEGSKGHESNLVAAAQNGLVSLKKGVTPSITDREGTWAEKRISYRKATWDRV